MQFLSAGQIDFLKRKKKLLYFHCCFCEVHHWKILSKLSTRSFVPMGTRKFCCLKKQQHKWITPAPFNESSCDHSKIMVMKIMNCNIQNQSNPIKARLQKQSELHFATREFLNSFFFETRMMCRRNLLKRSFSISIQNNSFNLHI